MKITFARHHYSYNYKSLLVQLMTTTLSDDISIHYLTALKQELSLFMNRSKIEIEAAHLHQLGDSFLDQINERFSSENEIIRSIAFKWSDFIGSWMEIKQDYQMQVVQANEEVDEKTIAIENLQEIVAHLEKKVHTYEEEYEKLKYDLISISQRHQKLQNESLLLKKTLSVAHKEAESSNERHKHALSNLIKEKEILLDQIRSERKINTDLNEENAHNYIKIEQLQKQIKNYASRLMQALRYNKEMETILNQKNQTIAKLQNELQAAKSIHKVDNFHSYFDSQTHQINPDPQVEQTLNQSIKLQDQIPYGQPFAYQFHRRLSQLNFNPSRMLNLNEDEPTQSHSVFKMNMDPYFSHFVLTSQSVKIKEDCEQLLNIDAKPFYSQIVQKRIPMHLWDQWIRNKLKEELRIRKAAGSDSEDQ